MPTINPATGMLIPSGEVNPYPKFKSEHFYMFGGINSKASAYANSPNEFRDISNLNFLYPGALTKRPGSTMYAGSTVTGNIMGGYEYSKSNGNSVIVFTANTNLYTATPPNAVTPVVTNLANGAIFDFVTFVDRLFCCSGSNFFRYDGVNNYKYSLPPGATAAWGVTIAQGGSLINTAVGLTTGYLCAYGYVNDRGYLGPVSNGITIFINGITFNSITYYGMTSDQSGYGITAIQLWRTLGNGVDLYGTTFLALGGTQASDIGFPLGTSLALPHLWFTLLPRFQSIFNNQYFMSGFSQFPSRVYWSEIGEPEAVQPTYYFDVVTNDGDRLTGHKLYNNSLILGKLKSIYRLTGDNPNNFALSQVTGDYGSLSHKSMVTFQNYIWMLDQKGIVQFDGAICDIISDHMEQFFLNMNVAAAVDTATAVHFKQYSEIWFHIPYSGATLNNLIIVYDYVSKAWTHYDGIQASCLFIAQGTQSAKTVFYGGYTGAVFFVGSSLMGDNGNAITCMAFTRWLAPSGQTTENMYRRFWGDLDPILGVNQSISINLFKNYNSTNIQYTGVIAQSTYQSRLDFGISARTIAAQFFHVSSTLPFKINAYTFESRYQRSV